MLVFGTNNGVIYRINGSGNQTILNTQIISGEILIAVQLKFIRSLDESKHFLCCVSINIAIDLLL